MLKDMKKVLSFVVCVMMIFSAFVVSADAISITQSNITSSESKGIVTVTVPYTVPAGFSSGSQISLLAYLSSTGSAIDSAVALDQITYDGSGSSISFKVNKTDVGNQKIYIKMGGTKLAASSVAEYSLPTTNFTVEFYNSTDAFATIIGSPVDVVQGTALTAAQIPANPSVTNKKFKYWTKDGTTQFDLSTTDWKSIADTTGVVKLYAYMTDYYEATITFSTITGSPVTTVGGKIPAGTTIPTATTTEENKVFSGWALTANGTAMTNAQLLAYDFGSETDSTNAVTLYPIFSDSTSYVLGDIDNDGDPTSFDALEALEFEAGLKSLSDTAKLAGDVDGDGDVTSFDALEILEYEAGLRSKFSSQE